MTSGKIHIYYIKSLSLMKPIYENIFISDTIGKHHRFLLGKPLLKR